MSTPVLSCLNPDPRNDSNGRKIDCEEYPAERGSQLKQGEEKIHGDDCTAEGQKPERLISGIPNNIPDREQVCVIGRRRSHETTQRG
ncbi:MAG: hypothetical protein O3C40_28615 [Planctomycetota bacterium]|nr:hypothetical protein [Planctomycetota bacterium]